MKPNFNEDVVYMQFPISLSELPACIAERDKDNIIEFIITLADCCDGKAYYSDFVSKLAQHFEQEFRRVNQIS